MGLKINVGKSKMQTVKKDQMGSCEKVRVNGGKIQKVDKFNYLREEMFGGQWQSCGRRT